MFKSISFAVLAMASVSAHAVSVQDEQENIVKLSKTIFMNEQTVFENNFTTELVVMQTDFAYGQSETTSNQDDVNFSNFNKVSISKLLSVQ